MAEKISGENPSGVKWDFLKERIKAQLDVALATDLFYAQRKREELYTAMQLKLGKTREEIDRIISSL